MKNLTRDIILDALRGIALFLMLFAHAENIFNNGLHNKVSLLNSIGTTFALTIFVMASGISNGYSYFNEDSYGPFLFIRALKRFLKIYFLYLILNLVYIFLSRQTGGVLTDFLGAAVFINPQIYTEFLIPLMVLPFLGLFIRKLPSKIYRSPFVIFLLAVAIYLLGTFGASYSFPHGIESITSLFVGSFSNYRFPILQYGAVYLIGLRMGLYLKADNSDKTKKKDITQLLLIMIMFMMIFVFGNSALPSEYDLFRRWPPGAGFLLTGMLAVIGVYYLSTIAPKLSVWNGMSSVGKITLQVYFIHILLIYLYLALINYQFTNVILTILAVLSFIIVSILFGYFYIGVFKKNVFYISWKKITAIFVLAILNAGLIVGMVYAETKVVKTFNKITSNQNVSIVDLDMDPNISIYSTRQWILKNTKIPENLTVGTIKIALVIKLKTGRSVQIVITSGSGNQIIRDAQRVDGYNYKFDLFSDAFEPGEYEVYASLNDEPANISNTVSVKISYPLFMVWTLDYEGYDVSNKNLDAIAAFSQKFGMPLTHLFSPRIYTAADISASRANYLTAWVLNRQNNLGDEIGLHMHMHCDMIAATGLIPKTQPKWDGRDNCHDVPTTAYTYDDFTVLLIWAKDMFRDKGLPEPTTYRAGGWFIGTPQLQALQDQGFLIDTSGRTAIKWGNIQSPWTLLETTIPYHPSATDQNKSIPEPTLTLWEFPNNGMDSTNNNVSVLKSAFDKNYTGIPLNQSQVLTYMSHPHWFTTYDQPRVNDLLQFTSLSKAVDDNGPILYVTSNQALNYLE